VQAFIVVHGPSNSDCTCVVMFQAGVEDLEFTARLHISMSPLLNEIPVVGAIQVSNQLSIITWKFHKTNSAQSLHKLNNCKILFLSNNNKLLSVFRVTCLVLSCVKRG
jgi:hypothetical protein